MSIAGIVFGTAAVGAMAYMWMTRKNKAKHRHGLHHSSSPSRKSPKSKSSSLSFPKLDEGKQHAVHQQQNLYSASTPTGNAVGGRTKRRRKRRRRSGP